MHGQRGDIGAQADRQMPALAEFKRAFPLFEPAFELGASPMLKIQQICCLFNKHVALIWLHLLRQQRSSIAVKGCGWTIPSVPTGVGGHAVLVC